jgi:hypothetical protein
MEFLESIKKECFTVKLRNNKEMENNGKEERISRQDRLEC